MQIRMGLSARIEKSSGKIVSDTCMVSPVEYLGFKVI